MQNKWRRLCALPVWRRANISIGIWPAWRVSNAVVECSGYRGRNGEPKNCMQIGRQSFVISVVAIFRVVNFYHMLNKFLRDAFHINSIGGWWEQHLHANVSNSSEACGLWKPATHTQWTVKSFSILHRIGRELQCLAPVAVPVAARPHTPLRLFEHIFRQRYYCV